MMVAPNLAEIQATLDAVVEKARRNRQCGPADYIPELASVPLELTSAAVLFTSGDAVVAGDTDAHRLTFQSSAKLLPLNGLLEERGPVEVRHRRLRALGGQLRLGRAPRDSRPQARQPADQLQSDRLVRPVARRRRDAHRVDPALGRAPVRRAHRNRRGAVGRCRADPRCLRRSPCRSM